MFWFGFSELVKLTNLPDEPVFDPFYAYEFIALGAFFFIVVDPLVWIWSKKKSE